MASAVPFYASIPILPDQGLLIGRRCHLRLIACRATINVPVVASVILEAEEVEALIKRVKDTNKTVLPHPSRRLKHSAVTCCLGPVPDTPSISPGVVTNMEAIKVLSESMQRFASSHAQNITISDLDPQTAKLLAAISGPFLSAFGLLFILRIVMSWYPKLPVSKLPYVIAYAPTEPFLVITRKVIPPVGGVDVTPVVWFGLVSFLNEILVGPQGLLVLLSRQL